MDTVLQFCIGLLPSLITGVLLAAWNRKQNRNAVRAEERDADRRKAEILEISLLVATAQLSYALAMAVKRGTPNGEVEDGIKQYEKAMSKFREFEREQIAKNVAS